MLSFELSVIDIVLVIAVIVLLLLFLEQRKGQSTTTSELLDNGQEKTTKLVKNTQKGLSTTQTPYTETGYRECLHHFGYLKNLPTGTFVPSECFGCPKVMRCLLPSEQNQVLQ